MIITKTLDKKWEKGILLDTVVTHKWYKWYLTASPVQFDEHLTDSTLAMCFKAVCPISMSKTIDI